MILSCFFKRVIPLKNNSICAICGKPYYTCNSCDDYKRLYPWKMFTDTSEHYKIYQIIHGHSIGIYNKNETKEKLQNVNLSDLETLTDSIQKTIKEIFDIKDVEKTKGIIVTNSIENDNITKRKKKNSKQKK